MLDCLVLDERGFLKFGIINRLNDRLNKRVLHGQREHRLSDMAK